MGRSVERDGDHDRDPGPPHRHFEEAQGTSSGRQLSERWYIDREGNPLQWLADLLEQEARNAAAKDRTSQLARSILDAGFS